MSTMIPTATSTARPARPAPPDRMTTDLTDLRRALAPVAFPAPRDDLLAVLIGRRAPLRLLNRVGTLGPDHLYLSLDEVCADVLRRARPPAPRP
jgi:hypothetical protein